MALITHDLVGLQRVDVNGAQYKFLAQDWRTKGTVYTERGGARRP
jgi:hypothetical protein